MGDKPIVEPNSTLAKARANMGIEEEDVKDLEEPQEGKVEKEKQPEPKEEEPESEPTRTLKEEPEEGESEEESEEEEGKEEGDKSTSKSKIARPLKALFTQIGELRKEIAELKKTTPETEEIVKEFDDSLKVLADEIGADPESLKKLYGMFQKQFLGELESKGILKKDLPEVSEKLKLLDNLVKEQESKKSQERQVEEVNHFNKEWDELLSALKKQFPFAGAGEYAEARKLMDKLAHSKEGGVVVDEKNKILKPYSLDYILFRNKDKFTAILKVASNKKSGEIGGREMGDVEDEEDIDLDPEKMTPDKWKKHEKRRQKEFQTEEPEFIG
ncbi:MAG: hypothetical protein QMD65_02035 [Patescibacteria group bacterium]|nr:hypothetical protein [Patescibacteria group bacterium]